MGTLKLIVVALAGLLGTLPAATAQDSGVRLQTPSTASVSAAPSQQLAPGNTFTFILRFNRPPEGYGGGSITYSFENDHPVPQALYPDYFRSSVQDQTSLNDGQAVYIVSFPITDTMRPGTWKLVAVTLGRRVMSPVTIPQDVTFEVRPAPSVLIHIHGPRTIRAGQRLVLTIDLAAFPPTFDQGCRLILQPNVHQIYLPHQSSTTYSVNSSSVDLSREQRTYEMSWDFEPDLPSGAWEADFSVNVSPKNPTRQMMLGMAANPCRIPPLEGDTAFSFAVEPDLSLVTPTSVAVTVNPSQVQLLLGEADRLRARVSQIEDQLRSGNQPDRSGLLLNSLQAAVKDVDETEKKYKERGSGPESSAAVDTFFDDIRLSYGDALKDLASETAASHCSEARVKLVSVIGGFPTSRLPAVSTKALGSILHNARAYDVAASTQALTFTLDIYSEPQGATISYRLREGEYHAVDHETDWRIENLTRAVYFIRLQKTGYEEKEVPFDAIDDTSTSIHVKLRRKPNTP